MSPEESEVLRRWRLILGRHAQKPLEGEAMDRRTRDLDRTLSWLYDREHAQRGLMGKGGGLEASQLTPIEWLGKVHELFPREVSERIEIQALEDYGLTDLLKSPELLERIEPNEALARTLMTMRGRLGPEMQQGIRRIVAAVVEDLMRRLRPAFRNSMLGRRNRFRRSHLPSVQNFDAQGTLRANLRHFDRATGKLPIRRPLFHSRQRRQLPWTVILCVDQSGSMADSVLHSAVVAGILAGTPSVNFHLVTFDTQVLDLTHLSHDPVEVLMGIQLGGGTDIGKALRYAEGLVTVPHRTVVVLLSDFEEGGSPTVLLQCVARLRQARVRLLGLAALGFDGEPWYDRNMAGRLAALGMPVAALTPLRLAEWLAEQMS